MKTIEKKLEAAIKQVTPDDFDAIQKSCEMKSSDTEQLQVQKSSYESPMKRWRPVVGVMAAACMVLVMLTGWNYLNQPMAAVALDVNPSITLDLNSREQVVGVEALNQEGEQILGDMDLKGTQIDVAVNALIGAMVKEGYLSDLENSVLMTVSGKDSDKDSLIQEKLLHSVRRTFEDSAIDGSIISQIINTTDAEVEQLVKDYGVSTGKAMLAWRISSKTEQLNVEDMMSMTIHEMNLLAMSKRISLPGVIFQGTASSAAYVSEEQMKEKALELSGLNGDEVQYTNVSMDYIMGKVTYEVEFYKNQEKYEYEFDAVTGELVEWEKEWKTQELAAIELEEVERGNNVEGIGEQKALEIAAEHANVDTKDIVFGEAVPTYENGQEFYDVDFYTEKQEYDYKIDAATGEVLEYVVKK